MYQFAVFRTKEGGVIQHFCLKYTCGGMIFKTLLHSINIKVYFKVARALSTKVFKNRWNFVEWKIIMI